MPNHPLLAEWTSWIPPEGIKILLVLFLCFLIGLEREEHQALAQSQAKTPLSPIIGGVRTFPLIGLIGYALTLLSGGQLLPPMIGFAVVGAFLIVSYKRKLDAGEGYGATTEVSALVTYIIGVLVSANQFWIATTLAVIAMLLLELKNWLEGFSRRLPAAEVLAITKFLLLTAVILPILPNRDYGPFSLNPFKAWLIVVAASGISYISYLLEKANQGRGGVFVSALIGGAYSSTVTTVVLAKRARQQGQASCTYAGAILMSCGVMYLRTLILIAIFSLELARRLAAPFLLLGAAGVLAGWLWSRRREPATKATGDAMDVRNPLELSAAFLFALLYIVLLAATHYVTIYWGRGGVYGLSALSGVVDITPLVLGMTQAVHAATPLDVAAGGILIAAASNNVVKGCYALGFADRKTGREALLLLLVFAAAGLLPLAFIR